MTETDLVGEFDAMKWAEEFQRIVVDGGLTIDKELMLSWFANAIMAGHDYARNHPSTTESTVVVAPGAIEDLAGGGWTYELTPDPFYFTYTDGQGSLCDNPDEGHLSLESAVHQALGYASVCWSEPPTGVFLTRQVKSAGDALIAFVEDML